MSDISKLQRKPNYTGLVERIKLLDSTERIQLLSELREIIKAETQAELDSLVKEAEDKQRLLTALNGTK